MRPASQVAPDSTLLRRLRSRFSLRLVIARWPSSSWLAGLFWRSQLRFSSPLKLCGLHFTGSALVETRSSRPEEAGGYGCRLGTRALGITGIGPVMLGQLFAPFDVPVGYPGAFIV